VPRHRGLPAELAVLSHRSPRLDPSAEKTGEAYTRLAFDARKNS